MGASPLWEVRELPIDVVPSGAWLAIWDRVETVWQGGGDLAEHPLGVGEREPSHEVDSNGGSHRECTWFLDKSI